MSQRQIFKITILSPDVPLFDNLTSIFGIDFEKAKTETSGASFSYSHFQVEETMRLTAQFWMLDASPQWVSIRNLYFKGASGIIILHDPTIKNASALNKRLLREFVSSNRFPVPMLVIHIGEGEMSNTEKLAADIERWCGYSVPVLTESSDQINTKLNTFMNDIKDWRARNVIFQTLKLYFSLDAISYETREVSKIISQLRRIYTSGYYELLSDEQLFDIIQQSIVIEGFQYDPESRSVVYTKEIEKNPWSYYESKVGPSEFSKPSVKKLD